MRDAFARRGNAMRNHGVDAELLDREAGQAMVPFLGFDSTCFPIRSGLLQRRGSTVRHDAMAWGYARAADQRGVDIRQHTEVPGICVEATQRHGRGVQRRGAAGRPPQASRRWWISRTREPCSGCAGRG